MADNVYLTVQGDGWDAIALAVYGDVRFTPELIKANPAHRDALVFSDGIALTVPDIEPTEAAGDLPPWKAAMG